MKGIVIDSRVRVVSLEHQDSTIGLKVGMVGTVTDVTMKNPLDENELDIVMVIMDEQCKGNINGEVTCYRRQLEVLA